MNKILLTKLETLVLLKYDVSCNEILVFIYNYCIVYVYVCVDILD